jgi:uncharacterized protein YukE
MTNQIRAEFATLDQLAADQAAHAGSIDGYREALRQHVLVALNDLSGGLGTAEHEACMRQVDQLIDDHITTTNAFQRTTGTVNDTFMAGGQRSRAMFANGT